MIIVYTFHFNTHNLADNTAKDHVHSEATLDENVPSLVKEKLINYLHAMGN